MGEAFVSEDSEAFRGQLMHQFIPARIKRFELLEGSVYELQLVVERLEAAAGTPPDSLLA